MRAVDLLEGLNGHSVDDLEEIFQNAERCPTCSEKVLASQVANDAGDCQLCAREQKLFIQLVAEVNATIESMPNADWTCIAFDDAVTDMHDE